MNTNLPPDHEIIEKNVGQLSFLLQALINMGRSTPLHFRLNSSLDRRTRVYTAFKSINTEECHLLLASE